MYSPLVPRATSFKTRNNGGRFAFFPQRFFSFFYEFLVRLTATDQIVKYINEEFEKNVTIYLVCVFLSDWLFQFFRGHCDKAGITVEHSDLEGTCMFTLESDLVRRGGGTLIKGIYLTKWLLPLSLNYLFLPLIHLLDTFLSYSIWTKTKWVKSKNIEEEEDVVVLKMKNENFWRSTNRETRKTAQPLHTGYFKIGNNATKCLTSPGLFLFRPSFQWTPYWVANFGRFDCIWE